MIRDLINDNPLLKDYFSVFLFEDIPAKSKPSIKTYIEEVKKSEIYIGIFGNKYGHTGKDKMSATEREFRIAQEKGSEILIFIKGKDDKKREKQVRNLILEMKDPEKGYVYKRFMDLHKLNNFIHESLLDFLRNKGIVRRTAFDETVNPEASLKDIDEKRIKWLLKIAKEKRNYSLDLTTSVKDTLIHLNLLNDAGMTNSSILLFGKKVKKYFIQAEVKCIQFPSTEVEKPFTSYHIYDGNIFEQINKAYAFVLDCIRMPVMQQKETVQVARPYEIPEFVIQEAIVNAIAHRDYNSTGAVQVMVFLDRVEIWNPGKLPSQLTIDKLRKPHTSYPNNPLLAEVLYLTDYIQKAGSGTLEMIKQCRKKGLPEPEYIEDKGEFRTIIARDVLTEKMLSQMGLNERQKRIIYILKTNKYITLSVAKKEFLDISEKTVYRDLQYLVKKGLLKEIGEKKGRKYIIK